MIRWFRDAATARLLADEDVPRFRAMERRARRKLLLLNNAGALNDLRQPPANRLEALEGDRQGQHLIRIIYDRMADIFVWRDGGVLEVPDLVRRPLRLLRRRRKQNASILIPPGYPLAEESMKPNGISQDRLSRDIDGDGSGPHQRYRPWPLGDYGRNRTAVGKILRHYERSLSDEFAGSSTSRASPCVRTGRNRPNPRISACGEKKNKFSHFPLPASPLTKACCSSRGRSMAMRIDSSLPLRRRGRRAPSMTAKLAFGRARASVTLWRLSGRRVRGRRSRPKMLRLVSAFRLIGFSGSDSSAPGLLTAHPCRRFGACRPCGKSFARTSDMDHRGPRTRESALRAFGPVMRRWRTGRVRLRRRFARNGSLPIPYDVRPTK